MGPARHGQSVFELGVDHSVSAYNQRARLVYFLLAAGKNSAQHVERQLVRRERNDIHRGERLSAHRVDIGQCVRGGDLSKVERIVNDGRKEIHRLHESEVVGDAKYPSVVEGLSADEQTRIRFYGK